MSNAAPSLDTGTKLALDRTWLAHERTMLAWVRTAASLISFGFTIYKFFQLELGKQAADTAPLIGARGFAMILISMGIGSLILAAIEHRRSTLSLKAMYGDVEPRSVAGLVAGAIGALGLLSIILVYLRQ